MITKLTEDQLRELNQRLRISRLERLERALRRETTGRRKRLQEALKRIREGNHAAA